MDEWTIGHIIKEMKEYKDKTRIQNYDTWIGVLGDLQDAGERAIKAIKETKQSYTAWEAIALLEEMLK